MKDQKVGFPMTIPMTTIKAATKRSHPMSFWIFISHLSVL